MAKYDFNNSRYAAFFNSSEGRAILQSFIDTSEMINVNYGWWKTQFSKAPYETPTDADGKATFMVKARKESSAPMMDMRAPLGEPLVMETKGVSFYTGTIVDFISKAIEENAMEREYNERLFQEFGNDADIIREWVKRTQTLIDGKDQTLNYMGAYLISRGKLDWEVGQGIHAPIQKAEIPEENFVNAGEKVWTAPDCKILDQMVIIEDKFRQRTGYQGAMKWQVTLDQYQKVFLNNAQVKEWVMYLRNLNTNSPQLAPEIAIIPDELFTAAVSKYPKLSPIEIVQETEKDKTWAGEKMVHGWKEGVAVLRPVGDAGLIQYTEILDRTMAGKFGNNVVDINFGVLDGGIAYLANATMANGRYRSWQTSVMMSATPCLTEFPNHIIVDTTVAD